MTTETIDIHQGPQVDFESNLPPDLQEFVRTPDFKAWFGDWENDPGNASKIVDENGEPLIVYAGLPAGITQLSGDTRRNTGATEIGFYSSKYYPTALTMAKMRHDRHGPVPSSVYGMFLNMRDPYVKQPGDGVNTARVREAPEGYDGYINDGARELVVFDPAQTYIVGEERINP